ncbi:hypothetical protein JM654_01695 [Microbacterium oxydans]|nr:hypothetical protein [Microbacterium oxydans]
MTANGTRSTGAASSGRVTVTVPARGLVALVVRDVDVQRPELPFDDIVDHGPDSFHEVDSDPATEYGVARGMLLVRPDGQGYDAYVQIDTEQQATLSYRIGGNAVQQAPQKAYPFEWTIPVDDLTDTFRYTITSGGVTTPEVTLKLPARISGANPGLAGDVIAQATGTAGDRVPLTIEVRNATDDPITGTVAITLPSGWQLDGAVPAVSVPAQGSARVESAAVIATAAPLGEVEVKAKLTVTGEDPVTLRPAAIEVIDRRRLVSLTSDVEIVSGPGAVAKLTALVINTGGDAPAGHARPLRPHGVERRTAEHDDHRATAIGSDPYLDGDGRLRCRTRIVDALRGTPRSEPQAGSARARRRRGRDRPHAVAVAGVPRGGELVPQRTLRLERHPHAVQRFRLGGQHCDVERRPPAGRGSTVSRSGTRRTPRPRRRRPTSWSIRTAAPR